MSNKLLLGALLLIFVGGIYFFSDGLTGAVISQTCCSDSDCPIEKQCPAEHNPFVSGGEIILGIVLLAIAALTYGVWYIGSRL